MSREIKFRAWDKENECWLNFGYASIYRKEDGEPDTIFKFDFSDNYIVEQYTGLKDKNGKEIYEGDIVNVDGQRCVMRAFVRPALIESGFALFDPQIRQRELQERSADTAEVIGNIHESPELLGGEE